MKRWYRKRSGVGRELFVWLFFFFPSFIGYMLEWGRKLWECAAFTVKCGVREREFLFTLVAHYKWNPPLVSLRKIQELFTLFSDHVLFWLTFTCMQLHANRERWGSLALFKLYKCDRFPEISLIELSVRKRRWGAPHSMINLRRESKGDKGGTSGHVVLCAAQQLIGRCFIRQIFVVLCAGHCAAHLEVQWKKLWEYGDKYDIVSALT